MIARRLLRAIARPVKRLIRPLRLRHLDYLAKHSRHLVERIQMARADLVRAEHSEHRYQVRLEARRNQIERG